ncbi:MAG: hypothetical protein IJW40_04000 [Clostridia bacterium]|nr:hypothetical protein [Clostridia bacterium]
MKKLLTLTLAAIMLLTSLISCRMETHDYFGEAMEENPEIELPKSDVMEIDPEDIPQYEINDSIKEYDKEETFEIPETEEYAAGELIVKYKICEYKEENVAIVSVENHSDQPLTISINGLCEDTLEGRSKTIQREFVGFAAGWQNYFVFPPQFCFDEFSYELEFEVYEGKTYGQYVGNLEWGDIALIRWPDAKEELNAVAMEMMFFYDWLGKSSESCYYGCHFVLFDSNGEILVLEMDDATRLEQKGCDSLGPLSPTTGWYRSPLHYTIGVDPTAKYDELGFTYNNSNGKNCAYFPASDAYEASGYKLPDPYQDAYGIVCFTGLWSSDIAWNEIPDNPLYQ